MQLLPCLSKELLGLNCPMCGFQRSLLSLLNGDFHGSWAMYPPLAAVLFYAPIVVLYLFYRRRSGVYVRFFRTYSYALLGVILLNHIARALVT